MRLNESCPVTKTCSICQRSRHNLEFYSNRKGRTALKSYCKHCQPIYDGIQQGLIPHDVYQGLDFNTDQLIGDATGHVVLLYRKSFTKISVIDATALVKQGGAHVTSPGTIESLTSRLLKNRDLRSFILNRDGHKCHYCTREGVTLDHVIPKSRGGLNTPLNLVACCEQCNHLKGDMSKKHFLKKIHNNEFDYLHQTWKYNIQARHEKKCMVCRIKHPLNKFSPHKNYCLDCTKFLSAYQLGYITSKEIARHHENAITLISTEILVYDSSMHVADQLETNEARNLVYNGMAKIIDPTSIQMLFNSQQLKRMFPYTDDKNVILKMMNKSPETPTEAKMKKKTPGSTIGIYDKNHKYTMGVHKSAARQLISQGEATILKKNKIKLTLELDDLLNKHPELSQALSQSKRSIHHGCHLLENTGGFTIPLNLSDELVQKELAEPSGHRRVQLQDHLINVVISVPRLINYLNDQHKMILFQSESGSNTEVWEYEEVMALDHQAQSIEKINKNEAVRLIERGMAEVNNTCCITLNQPGKTSDKIHFLENKTTHTA